MLAYLDLYDYRKRVAAIYEERLGSFLAGEQTEMIWQRFRFRRDALFREHPQSALDEEQKRTFQKLLYFPYRSEFCVPARIESDIEPVRLSMLKGTEEEMTMITVARLHFTLQKRSFALTLYWINVYGGGLFLPFRDATCPKESYGGGRYLFDTLKGSTFLPVPGSNPQQSLLLDFNYAYNPSCAYNPRWVCPLSPSENVLDIAIAAGEKKFDTSY
ncbi:MAG TPA: DUF1684 domain-containing protein [Ktedonobacteraceae bacterium]|nr:DUF1684 domain-containing protein [Ktedonobacteraceae bacterium]